MKSKLQSNKEKYIPHMEYNKRNYRLERDQRESVSCACLRLRAERR